MTDATDELLAARRQTHGDYGANAELIQGIMRLLEAAPRWPEISDVHREGVHMIVHKISRALNGDPMEPDHFDDVAGYAKLIANWIRANKPTDEEQALNKMISDHVAKDGGAGDPPTQRLVLRPRPGEPGYISRGEVRDDHGAAAP